MSALAYNEGAGAARTAAGPGDAKAERPTSPLIVIATRWPARFVSAWIVACRVPPDLPCVACEAMRRGGAL